MLSCNECKFASRSENIQTGCNLNKLEKFIELNAASIQPEDNSYSLSRICMFKRSEDWNGDILEETQIKMGYIFIIKDKDSIQTFKDNIELIKDKNPLWIGVLHSFNSLNNEICNILDTLQCKYNIVCQYTQDHDINKIDQFLPHMKAGWTLVNVVGEEFLVDAKNRLNYFINEQLGMAGIIKNEGDSLNGFCFFNIFFKFHKGSKIEYDQNENLYIYKSFEYKVKEKDENMVKLWGDIL